ncbi:MAG: DNA-processing protein DprA [Candidatus Omnitrophica bacterium]|nr:DNA-processing protein DprA [Candidatus Omnitrophota bacterium]
MEIKKIDIENESYPAALRDLHNPPMELFINGEILPCDINAVAIVGTRWATHYGLAQSERISYELASIGITIISGMARGIDTAAHRGALKARGRTISVLGSGHNHIYPRENKKLYEAIAKSGAVISEFPSDVPPLKPNFPRRNRLISGMSRGVLVVEAPKRSGALITANFALEQGKEVFAVPGNINSVTSSGTNGLIKEGAKLVEGVDDILQELVGVIDIHSAGKIPDESGPDGALLPALSGEKVIFGVLSDEPKSIDEISRITNLPVAKISEILIRLELKKMIKMLPGDNFVRV